MRKVGTVTITDENRDKDKVFVLTEMPASRAERWATRVVMGLIKVGVEIPEESGMEAIAKIGLQALASLSFDDAQFLMDEMMQCVHILPDPKKNPTFTRPLMEEDIEEVSTRVRLRLEVFTLHTGFSFPGKPSILVTASPGLNSTHTGTSRQQSRR
jgi:hypothetical protein